MGLNLSVSQGAREGNAGRCKEIRLRLRETRRGSWGQEAGTGSYTTLGAEPPGLNCVFTTRTRLIGGGGGGKP